MKMTDNKLTKLFLKRRGYTNSFLTEINNPKHQKLQNIDALCEILKKVHDEHEKLVIMPDFDTDGISAGTLGFAGFSELGFNVSLYMPDPRQGYGITKKDIDKVLAQYPDVKYIITCDVGITCYEAFKYAYERGLKVLVTDHHEEEKIKPEPLKCEIIVDPCQLSETYRLREICGAYVLWQVLNNYAALYADANIQDNISLLRVFAGVGTVGDMMTVYYENRKLLKDMIALLKFIYNDGVSDIAMSLGDSQPYKRAIYGLFALLKSVNKFGGLRNISDLDEKFVGWTIAPMYNSVKRLGLDMSLVFGIFFADQKTQEKNSETLIQTNETRKKVVNAYFEKIQEEFITFRQPYAPFIYFTDAPGGILGLLANQLQQINNLPTFVINKSTLSGSGRSYDYFPVISTLSGTDYNVKGHENAFGISFKNKKQVSDFHKYLVDKILPLAKEYEKTAIADADLTLAPVEVPFKIDDVIDTGECFGFYQGMQLLKPFGQKLPEPVVKIIVPTSNCEFKVMGHEKQHLKVILGNNLELIAWNSADMLDDLQKQKYFDFYGMFSVNNFGGKVSLQMIGDFAMMGKDNG